MDFHQTCIDMSFRLSSELIRFDLIFKVAQGLTNVKVSLRNIYFVVGWIPSRLAQIIPLGQPQEFNMFG